MRAVLDEQERARVVDLARKHLAPHQPEGYRLEVLAEEIHQDDDWYYVVVKPSRSDVRSYDYSQRLAEAELDLQEKENVKILLVPALPS